MVFQITPLQVYRTDVTFPRSMPAEGKDPNHSPRKLKQTKNGTILTSMQLSGYLKEIMFRSKFKWIINFILHFVVREPSVPRLISMQDTAYSD